MKETKCTQCEGVLTPVKSEGIAIYVCVDECCDSQYFYEENGILFTMINH